MAENTTQKQTVGLMQMLGKATSTRELPETFFARGQGLSNEKAVLFLLQHLEGIDEPSPDNGK